MICNEIGEEKTKYKKMKNKKIVNDLENVVNRKK